MDCLRRWGMARWLLAIECISLYDEVCDIVVKNVMPISALPSHDNEDEEGWGGRVPARGHLDPPRCRRAPIKAPERSFIIRPTKYFSHSLPILATHTQTPSLSPSQTRTYTSSTSRNPSTKSRPAGHSTDSVEGPRLHQNLLCHITPRLPTHNND